MTYTKEDLIKCKSHHDITPNGIAFEWWLASSEGAGFCLLRESHHTREDIAIAKHYLKNDRDVVGRIKVEKVQA